MIGARIESKIGIVLQGSAVMPSARNGVMTNVNKLKTNCRVCGSPSALRLFVEAFSNELKISLGPHKTSLLGEFSK